MTAGLQEALRLLAIGVLKIDDSGRIWRLKIMIAGQWRDVSPRRAENENRKGYLRVTMGVGNHRTAMVQAHRLVWHVCHGPIPEGMQINHKDRDRKNNRPDNLELVTCKENIHHSIAGGRTEAWTHATEWRGKPRLTVEQIDEIRRRREGGESLASLGEAYSRHWAYISQLCRKGWARDPRRTVRGERGSQSEVAVTHR